MPEIHVQQVVPTRRGVWYSLVAVLKGRSAKERETVDEGVVGKRYKV